MVEIFTGVKHKFQSAEDVLLVPIENNKDF